MQLESCDILKNQLAFLACIMNEEITIDEALRRLLEGEIREPRRYTKRATGTHPSTKPIIAIDLDTGKEHNFPSVKCAARELDIAYSSIAGAMLKYKGLLKKYNMKFIIKK